MIATREELESVRLLCAGIGGDGDDSTRRACAFVLAIQQNSSIRSVHFASAMPRQVLTSFLDHVGAHPKALELTASVEGNSLEDSRDVALLTLDVLVALKSCRKISRSLFFVTFVKPERCD